MHQDKMGAYEDILRGLERAVVSKGNVSRLAEAAGEAPSLLTRWIKRERVPKLDKLGPILDMLGARVIFPGEDQAYPLSEGPAGIYSFHEPGRPYGELGGEPSSRDVCWVEPKIISAENGAPPPLAEKYLAVPLAEGPVAAGPGMVPEDKIKSWVLVFRDHPSVKFRTNLVAVEIGRGQESMVPTLHPQDIVLVDKDDRRPEPDGQIFLVRDPDDSVTVKRVYVQRKNGDTMLQFVSDNPDKRSYSPMLYNLGTDYQDDITRAIVGKCVWAWSDLTRK